MRHAVGTIVVLLVVVGSGMAADSQPAAPALLLEKGIYAEETLGNLDAAVALYRQAVEQSRADRQYAAQAQFRMAMCQLKKGDKVAATKGLQDLLATYPQEKDLAARAQKELAKLTPASPPGRLPGEVMGYIIQTHMKAWQGVQEKQLPVNCHIYGVDGEFNMYFGGLIVYRNATSQPALPPIYLTNFDSPPNFLLTDEQGNSQPYIVREGDSAKHGRYSLWWKPAVPVPAGTVRLLGYINNLTQELSRTKWQGKLTMRNHFGPPVLENFFLVVPNDLAVASSSRPADSSTTIGAFTIYLWQRNVPLDTLNQVEVTLEKGSPVVAGEFYVMGKVKRPGVYSLTGRKITVKMALAAADVGAQEKDWPAKGAIIRRVGADKEETIPLRIPAILKGQDPDVFLQPDDVILVGVEVDAAKAKELRSILTAETIVRSYMETGQFDKAAERYRGWLKADPDNAEAKAGLAKAEAADKALLAGAGDWLALLDKGDWAKAWETGSLLLRQVAPREQWGPVMKIVRGELGGPKARRLASREPMVTLPGVPGGPFIVLRYDTTFAAKRVWENVALARDSVGAWGVAGYTLEPYSMSVTVSGTVSGTYPPPPVAPAIIASADQWLKLIDEGKYADSWKGAAEVFRKASSTEEWARMARNARSPLGALTARKMTRAQPLTGAPEGGKPAEFIAITYETVFEKRTVTENIFMNRDPDGTWRVSGYFIK